MYKKHYQKNYLINIILIP